VRIGECSAHVSCSVPEVFYSLNRKSELAPLLIYYHQRVSPPQGKKTSQTGELTTDMGSVLD
jgi:hypothetical protein